MSLRDKVRSGLLWTSLVQVAARVINLLAVAVLARVLGPDAFGLLSMVMVVQAVTLSVSEMGIGQALIQRRGLQPDEVFGLFWLNLGTLTAVGAALHAAAPLVGAFFVEPRVVPLVEVSALIMVFDGLCCVPDALLRKDMKLAVRSRIEVVAMIAGALAGIAAAMHGLGVWSLIVQNAARTAVRVVLIFRSARFVPRWSMPRGLGWAYRYGLNSMGAGLLTNLARDADRFLIGRFLGGGALGLYTRAYALSDTVSSSVVGIAGQVLFPALASMDDDARIRRGVERALAITAFVLIPASAGMLCVGSLVIHVLYGDQWLGAVPLFEALSISLLLLRLSWPVNSLFAVKGRADLLLRWTLFAGFVMVVTVSISSQFGDVWVVAISNAAVSALLFIPRLYAGGRLVQLSPWRALAVIPGPALCSAAMAAAVLGLRPLLAAQPPWLQLLALSLVGAAAYATLAWRFRLQGFTEVLALLRPGRAPAG